MVKMRIIVIFKGMTLFFLTLFLIVPAMGMSCDKIFDSTDWHTRLIDSVASNANTSLEILWTSQVTKDRILSFEKEWSDSATVTEQGMTMKVSGYIDVLSVLTKVSDLLKDGFNFESPIQPEESSKAIVRIVENTVEPTNVIPLNKDSKPPSLREEIDFLIKTVKYLETQFDDVVGLSFSRMDSIYRTSDFKIGINFEHKIIVFGDPRSSSGMLMKTISFEHNKSEGEFYVKGKFTEYEEFFGIMELIGKKNDDGHIYLSITSTRDSTMNKKSIPPLTVVKPR